MLPQFFSSHFLHAFELGVHKNMDKSRIALCLLAAAMLPLAAQANDFELIGGSQGNIRDIARDLTAGLSAKALAPAEATGVIGFGVGVYGSRTSTEKRAAWNASTADGLGSINTVGLTVAKGLPLNIDVAAHYAKVTGTDASVYGAELRYAILGGSTLMPALTTRIAYSTTTGNDSFDFDTLSADVALSKGFVMVTPYAGAGVVRGQIDAHSLGKESVVTGRFFVGARLTLGFIQLTPEIERIGSNTVANLRIGFSI